MKPEQTQRIVKRIKLLTDEDNEALVVQLVNDAEEYVKSYTNRKHIPDALMRAIGDLAIVSLNRLGVEGEKQRSEAGETYSFESAPNYIFSVLDKFRLARCGGYAHEKKQD